MLQGETLNLKFSCRYSSGIIKYQQYCVIRKIRQLKHHRLSLNLPHPFLPCINDFLPPKITFSTQKTFILLLVLVLTMSIINMASISEEKKADVKKPLL